MSEPSKQAIEVARKIHQASEGMNFNWDFDYDTTVAEIIQAAIDEAIETHVDDASTEWEKRYTEVEARLMRSQHNHAEAVKQLIEAHKKLSSQRCASHR